MKEVASHGTLRTVRQCHTSSGAHLLRLLGLGFGLTAFGAAAWAHGDTIGQAQATGAAAMATMAPMGEGFFGSPLVRGVLHPFGGLDHLVALLSLGVWASMSGRRLWVLPLLFANVMLLGAGLGLGFGPTFGAQGFIEPWLAASLIACGVLLCWRQRAASAWAMPVVSAIALLHGAAHGLEIATVAGLGADVRPLAGLWFGSLLLMGGSAWLSHRAQVEAQAKAQVRGVLGASPRWQRVGGGMAVALGGVLLAQLW